MPLKRDQDGNCYIEESIADSVCHVVRNKLLDMKLHLKRIMQYMPTLDTIHKPEIIEHGKKLEEAIAEIEEKILEIEKLRNE